MLATVPLERIEARANLPHIAYEVDKRPGFAELADPEPVVVPDVRPYPAQFWENVAANYIAEVLEYRKGNPAVQIAEEAGVPVPTVRGWIAKCRQLGLIAKGSQGRLG